VPAWIKEAALSNGDYPKFGIWNREGAKDTKENKTLQCERRSPQGEYRH
jgi:hypothetical protein